LVLAEQGHLAPKEPAVVILYLVLLHLLVGALVALNQLLEPRVLLACLAVQVVEVVLLVH
jgi:hypothetical protein